MQTVLTLLAAAAVLVPGISALQPALQPKHMQKTTSSAQLQLINSRRAFLSTATALSTAAAITTSTSPASAADLPPFQTSKSGLQYADAKLGSGQAPTSGSPVAVDYSMQTTGARYGTKIYSTANTNNPFRFTVGDGTAIKGLEEAVIGGEGIPPMLPGGIRRVIIPSSLGYESLAKPIAGMQYQDCQEGKGVGPIPPVPEAFEEYQRFKNIYCNANRPYQPDLVMDIKLYGKRS